MWCPTSQTWSFIDFWFFCIGFPLHLLTDKGSWILRGTCGHLLREIRKSESAFSQSTTGWTIPNHSSLKHFNCAVCVLYDCLYSEVTFHFTPPAMCSNQSALQFDPWPDSSCFTWTLVAFWTFPVSSDKPNISFQNENITTRLSSPPLIVSY